MAKLKYPLTRDTLFKVMFVKNPDLLKRLIARLLGVCPTSIEEFVIKNPELLPSVVGNKRCVLDIRMIVSGQQVNLEVQVNNEGDYPERTLFSCAREYSSSINEGDDYTILPRTIHISIVDFPLFKCKEFHSEFRMLEVNRHTQLTDKLVMHYFELKKLPKTVAPNDELGLWLMLFKAKTKEDIEKIQTMEVPVMAQAIEAYHRATASEELREIERMRERAELDERYRMHHATKKLRQELAYKDAIIANKDLWCAKTIADKDAYYTAEISRLLAEVERLQQDKGASKN